VGGSEHACSANAGHLLHKDATTPRVKQYLDKMIAHCEGLVGKVEPTESSGADRRYAVRSRMSRNHNRLQPRSFRTRREEERRRRLGVRLDDGGYGGETAHLIQSAYRLLGSGVHRGQTPVRVRGGSPAGLRRVYRPSDLTTGRDIFDRGDAEVGGALGRTRGSEWIRPSGVSYLIPR
jgi:hypothetical protein